MTIQTFSNAMASVSPQKAQGMVRRINAALAKREAFERSKAPNSAHIELRAAIQQLQGNVTVARFLTVLEADPDMMLNRERKEGYRANLKAVRKIRMLAEYMAGQHGKINGVCKALFAATILAAHQEIYWVSNNDAELILSRIPLMQAPEELRLAVQDFNRLNIKDAKEARNQACQFRTAFENLNCYFSSREDEHDLSSNGIRANLTSPLIQALAGQWGL